MNLPDDYVLKTGELADPVLWEIPVTLAIPEIDEQVLIREFGDNPRAKRLHTWGHDEDTVHWIGCSNGTPLHYDPRSTRYSHQLVVRNDGWILHGMDLSRRHAVLRGTLYCFDSHSPHKLTAAGQRAGRFYVALVLDTAEPLSPQQAVRRLAKRVALEMITGPLPREIRV